MRASERMEVPLSEIEKTVGGVDLGKAGGPGAPF